MNLYIGRFAPTPSGPLHEGSLVAALASWLDARAQGGKWLVRIEDVDTPRNVKGADDTILQQLQALSLVPDEAPLWQSQRSRLYEAALDTLREKHLLYRCTCSRKDIEQAQTASGITRARNAELRYPGTCRGRMNTPSNTYTMYSYRVIANNNYSDYDYPIDSIYDNCVIHWHDRRLGAQQQDVQQTIGDFVLKRADGCYTYQLACVVDDALQGITHVVRGEDLADNTARQIVLQQHLAYATPQYLHTPLVLAADGQKLSKQNGAKALSTARPIDTLKAAMQRLGLQTMTEAQSVNDVLAHAVAQWQQLYGAA